MPKKLPKMTSFDPPTDLIEQSFIPFSGMRELVKKRGLPQVIKKGQQGEVELEEE